MSRLRIAPTCVLTPLLCLLTACGGSGTVEPTGSTAVRALERGQCPPSIIDDAGRNARGAYRYGRQQGTAVYQQLRQRELRNCETQVAGGDDVALGVLVSYWEHVGRKDELVRVMELYIPQGDDSQTLGNVGAYLYRAYAQGTEYTPRDSRKAFNYLTLAVNNGVTSLELNYVRELKTRGLHSDALPYLASILAAGPRGAYSTEEFCDAHLLLAESHFLGQGMPANWNTGYYYWLKGLQLAEGAQWGSCVRDNFVYGERYSRESQRKKAVEERIALLKPSARRDIEAAAGRAGFGGLGTVEHMPRRPSAGESPPLPGYASPGSGQWRPLQAQVCRASTQPYARSWADLFEEQSRAVWTVTAGNGSDRIQGSAVAVSQQLLVTNCHLLKNGGSIELRRGQARMPARLHSGDFNTDRCVIQAGTTVPHWVRHSRSFGELRIGEEVAAIGNPRGLDNSLSRGIIAQKRQRRGMDFIQTDAAIASGSSGGGLFDTRGNLLGITTFTLEEGSGLNFALSIDEFCNP